MENPNMSSLAMFSEPLEKTGKSLASAKTNLSLQQIPNLCQGPVAILWDIENCPVPSDVHPEEVAINIRMALRTYPVIQGAVTLFSAYGDFNAFPRRLREGCQRTGVKLIDVPNGRKDAADKAILVDMFLFALDNPPPSSIMLISGDVDFAPALHVLGQRGYTVILVVPSRVGVSSALCNAGSFVWNWSSVARGEGFLPTAKTSTPHRNSTDAPFLVGCHINDNAGCQNEDEAIVYRGISQTFYNAQDFSVVSESLSEYNRTAISIPGYPTTSISHSLPSGFSEVPAGNVCDQNDLSLVQPGDLNGLKGRLVKLLELSGGRLPFTRVPEEYQKRYGRSLCVSEYGSAKLVSLLKKMADSLTINGKRKRRSVCLRNSIGGQSAPPLILAKKKSKEKGAQEDNIGIVTGAGSSDECSDEERVVIEQGERTGDKCSSGMAAQSQLINQSLEKFKYELQEILVSYSCKVFMGCFEAIYQQRYKRQLDYQSFGVSELGELLEKVKDVVVLQEEPGSRRKFLVATCSESGCLPAVNICSLSLSRIHV